MCEHCPLEGIVTDLVDKSIAITGALDAMARLAVMQDRRIKVLEQAMAYKASAAYWGHVETVQ